MPILNFRMITSPGVYIFLQMCHKNFIQQDNLAFPLICPDWNADEEMLLLEVFSSGFELQLWRFIEIIFNVLFLVIYDD